MIFSLLASLLAQGARLESQYYRIDYFTPPEGARFEVGGLDFLSDGRLMLSTRRGQVWILDEPLADDPKGAKFSLFAEGLDEGLGLNVVGEDIYLVQRGELSILRDADRNGICDEIETVTNDWGLSGHYHEFAFGLPQDKDGNFYITLNVSFGNPHWWHGRSTVPYRGWAMQISPHGKVTPWAPGFRSPCGLGTNAEGDIFVTENQGDWMPACPIFHLQKGRFYGHPASLEWTDEHRPSDQQGRDTIPSMRERAPATVWIPYDWSRSTGALTFDSTQGKFGPFAEQLFVAELTNGVVLRADLEKVRGEYQGAVFPFLQHVGSAVRLCFASDGSLFVGFTDRGWGGQPPGDGLARIRWNGTVPLEVKHARLIDKGFSIELTEPLAKSITLAASDVRVEQYDYDYWWEYGSPTRHNVLRAPQAPTISADRKTLTVQVPDLTGGMVARVTLANVWTDDGRALLHDEFAYTVNQLRDNSPAAPHVAKVVQPPIAREKWEEGIVTLARGNALDAWRGEGWSVADIELDPDDAMRLRKKPVEPEVVPPDAPPPGATESTAPPKDDSTVVPVLTNVDAEKASDLVSRYEFGDVDVHVDFLLPEGGDGGVLFMDRYEVQLGGHTDQELDLTDCGALGVSDRFAGRAPNFQAFREAGEWHGLDVRFRAPRFDGSGKKTRNALFERVMIDDTLLQENVEVPEPSATGVRGPEVAFGPIRLQGDRGVVAYRSIVARPKNLPADDQGWTRIFDGKSLDGWQASDGGMWKVEDGAIVGSGARSHLFSPRGDYKDFELRAKVKINDGGNSGMYFRVAFGAGWPSGYEAQVNSTHTDPVKTGSLYNLALVKTRLVPPETWFEQRISCRDEADGVRVTIRVNGVVVTDYLDKERKHVSGHVAFQQHHEGSMVWYRDVEVREL